jgi:flagellar protein FliS
MTRPYGARSYVQTQVQSATPLQLVSLLYDAAVKSAATAHEAMMQRNIPARRDAINKLMDILTELQGSLDLERGGPIAAELDRIYTYLFTRLVEAVSTQTAPPIAEVHGLLLTLREAWQQLAHQAPDATAGGVGR